MNERADDNSLQVRVQGSWNQAPVRPMVSERSRLGSARLGKALFLIPRKFPIHAGVVLHIERLGSPGRIFDFVALEAHVPGYPRMP